MERRSVESVIRSLNDAGVRYLIVGGLAVVAHGHVRFTADMDLILDLDPENIRKAATALSKLGYRPRAPVRIEEFADAPTRERWVKEKGMRVFSLWSSEHQATEIDLFAVAPFDFAAAYACAARIEVSPGLPATFVDLERLLELKGQAARPQDLQDIERLKALQEGRGG